MEFYSAERLVGSEEPLLSGYLMNFGSISQDALEEHREKELLRLVQHVRKDRKFEPPYIVMDLVERKHIEIFEKTSKEKLVSESSETLKILMSVWDIVDLSNLSNDSNSIAKCNAAVPIYRWFQAANLLLKYKDMKGRVIPFPLDQEEGKTVFHMLRVTPEEYAQYQTILDFACSQNSVEKAFEIAARFSYEVLFKRGITKLTVEQVDHTMTHVILRDKSSLYGVAIEDAKREDLESEYLFKNQIFY